MKFLSEVSKGEWGGNRLGMATFVAALAGLSGLLMSSQACAATGPVPVIPKNQVMAYMERIVPLPQSVALKSHPVGIEQKVRLEEVRKSLSDAAAMETVNILLGGAKRERSNFVFAPSYYMHDMIPTGLTVGPVDSDYAERYCERLPRKCGFVGFLEPEGRYPVVAATPTWLSQGPLAPVQFSSTVSYNRILTSTYGWEVSFEQTLGSSGVASGKGAFKFNSSSSVAIQNGSLQTINMPFYGNAGQTVYAEAHANTGAYRGYVAVEDPGGIVHMLPAAAQIGAPSLPTAISWIPVLLADRENAE